MNSSTNYEVLVTKIFKDNNQEFANVIICENYPFVLKVRAEGKNFCVGDIVIGKTSDTDIFLYDKTKNFEPEKRFFNILGVFQNIDQRFKEDILSETPSRDNLKNLRKVYIELAKSMIEVLGETKKPNKASEVLLDTIIRATIKDIRSKDENFKIDREKKVVEVPESNLKIQKDVKNLSADITSLGIVAKTKNLKIENAFQKQQTLDLY